MTAPVDPARLDDVPVTLSPAAAPANPLDLFRHDRLPRWALIRNRFDAGAIDDVEAAVRAAFDANADAAAAIRPGQRVCILRDVADVMNYNLAPGTQHAGDFAHGLVAPVALVDVVDRDV